LVVAPNDSAATLSICVSYIVWNGAVSNGSPLFQTIQALENPTFIQTILLFNMKKTLTISFAVGLAAAISAQSIQEIATGAGYQKMSFVNLTAGTEKQVTNTVWDIAFSVSGQLDAGIFVNESAGSSMGQALLPVEVFDALTDDFNTQPDPATLVEYQLFNTEKTWDLGAFNERRNPDNALDFGWGEYNFQTHQVVGNAVYVLKLRNGDFRKFKMVSLAGNTYTFQYANLDGSNAVTKTIHKADHAGKTLAYFSFDSGNTVDVEPASGGFDLLYCRYITPLFDPGSMTYIPYAVTGVLSGPDTEVAKADGVNPASVQYSDFKDSLRSELDVIGYDWKTFGGTGWSLDDDLVFFLKAANDRVWKLQFIDFEGSTTGKAIFEKTDLGIIAAVQDPAALGLKVATYPNPVQDQLTVSLDIPVALAQNGQLIVVDLQGRIVLRQSVVLKEGFQVFQLPADYWASGSYFLQLQLPGQSVQLGKVVKN
jgi:hypothetical protein